MKVVEKVLEMSAAVNLFRESRQRVGFIPTMGCLHDGHRSLIEESVRQCDITIVSIFVNPVQFGVNEDFENYPRHRERDLELCSEAGVSHVFCPNDEDMYAADRSVTISENSLSKSLCGLSRHGHFDGVCTVVAKLFNIIRPDMAVFGQKDAQQLAIIRRMVRDLNFNVEIVGMPIVRESDGLAMSSRNVYLSAPERLQALGLSRMLALVIEAVEAGERGVPLLRDISNTFLRSHYPSVSVEYIDFVDADTMVPCDVALSGTLVAVAARVGQTRLIDNVMLP